MLATSAFTIVMPTLVYRLLLAFGVALSVATMTWPLLDKSNRPDETRAADSADQEAGNRDKAA